MTRMHIERKENRAMRRRSMKRRLAVAGLAAVMALSVMPATAFAAEAGEAEPVIENVENEENHTAQENIETQESIGTSETVVTNTTVEPVAENTAELAEAPAAEPVAEAIEAPAVEIAAEPVQTAAAEQEAAPVVTPAENISVNFHFMVLDANGNYVQARQLSRSVKSGRTTSSISLTTANGYVTSKNVNANNGRYTYLSSWTDGENGNQISFPLSLTYEEAAALAGAEETTDVYLYAQYSYRENRNLTFRYEGILKANGTTSSSSRTQVVSPGSSSSINLTTLQSATGVRAGQTFSFGGYRYTYTGQWTDSENNIIYTDGSGSDVHILDMSTRWYFYNKDGENAGNNYYLNEDLELVFRPVYEATMLRGLSVSYIDEISTGSGSWSNRSAGINSAFSSMSHTFRDPSLATPVDHYRFLRWDMTGNTDTFVSGETRENALTGSWQHGETYTYTVNNSLPEGTQTAVTFHAVWQPSVTVRYHIPGSLAGSSEEFVSVNEAEDFAEIDVYDYQPEAVEGAEFLGWYNAAGELISEDAAFTAPAETIESIEQYVENVYARYSTAYTVEHYLEQLDGTFALEEDATETYEGLIGADVASEEKEFTGFTFDAETEGTIASAKLAVGTVLRMYYTRNTYTVNYSYTGEVPEGAEEQLPESMEYLYGAEVARAEAPEVEGYTFSGWDGEVDEMPAGNVEVTGSWTAIPVVEDPEAVEEPEVIDEPEVIEENETPEAEQQEEDEIAVAVVPEVPSDNAGTGTPAAPAAQAPAQDVIEDEAAPMAPAAVLEVEEHEAEAEIPEILDEAVPMAAPAIRGSWALINLVITAVAILTCLGMVVTFFAKKREENADQAEGGEQKDNRKKSKFFGIIPAAAAVIAFLLTEDMTQPMQLLDKWTLLMAVILAAAAVLAVATRNRDDEDEAAAEA